LAGPARGQPPLLALTLAAFACGLAGMLITVKGNFPINDLVMTWSPHAPPADWASLRDRWWAWHCARTVVTVACFGLLLAAALTANALPPI
ncbi:MAG TPA: anthrone oxygenase family protein, partial [Burkholderiales bacterium]|nr:anthrone oxygenase family protein [Burkholderiales bacterium]